MLKNFRESVAPRILHTSIFNRLQLNTHACVSSRVMDDEMLPCNMCLSHLLYSIWNSCVGEIFYCETGRHNLHDRLTVSVKKWDITVGHIPLKVSRMCTLFIRRCLLIATRTWWKIQHPDH